MDAILSNLNWSQKSLELPSTSYSVSLKKAYQMNAANLCPALISNKQCNSFRDLRFICSYLNGTLPNQTAAVQQRAKQRKSLSSKRGGSYYEVGGGGVAEKWKSTWREMSPDHPERSARLRAEHWPSLLQYVCCSRGFWGSYLKCCQGAAAQYASDRPVHPTRLRQDPISVPSPGLYLYLPLFLIRRGDSLVREGKGVAWELKVKAKSIPLCH